MSICVLYRLETSFQVLFHVCGTAGIGSLHSHYVYYTVVGGASDLRLRHCALRLRPLQETR